MPFREVGISISQTVLSFVFTAPQVSLMIMDVIQDSCTFHGNRTDD